MPFFMRLSQYLWVECNLYSTRVTIRDLFPITLLYMKKAWGGVLISSTIGVCTLYY